MVSAKLVLLLAQMCVSEVSFQNKSDECILMVEINQRNADRRKISLEQQTLEFNAIFDPRTDVKRAWIFGLNHYGTMPDGWHGSIASWNYYRPRYMNYLSSIRRWLEREEQGINSPIARHANDYGGSMDNMNRCAIRIFPFKGKGLQRYWSLKQCRRSFRGRKRASKQSVKSVSQLFGID